MDKETLVMFWKSLDFEHQKAQPWRDFEDIKEAIQGCRYFPVDKQSCIFVYEDAGVFLVQASGHRIISMEEIPYWAV